MLVGRKLLQTAANKLLLLCEGGLAFLGNSRWNWHNAVDGEFRIIHDQLKHACCYGAAHTNPNEPHTHQSHSVVHNPHTSSNECTIAVDSSGSGWRGIQCQSQVQSQVPTPGCLPDVQCLAEELVAIRPHCVDQLCEAQCRACLPLAVPPVHHQVVCLHLSRYLVHQSCRVVSVDPIHLSPTHSVLLKQRTTLSTTLNQQATHYSQSTGVAPST